MRASRELQERFKRASKELLKIVSRELQDKFHESFMLQERFMLEESFNGA